MFPISPDPSLRDSPRGEREELREAVSGHLAVMRERGETVPEPTSETDFLDVVACGQSRHRAVCLDLSAGVSGHRLFNPSILSTIRA